MGKPEGYKSVHVYFTPDFHRKLKVAVAIRGTTMSKYIKGLVEADLEALNKKMSKIGSPIK